ncbi:cohesin domain-containing protein, partial [Lentimicrobium sp.]|uniref:cohesin domain-containing protein n=1 Tax=Lentimicrobium sp. TaxID=2034841 RepID=UPI002CF000BD
MKKSAIILVYLLLADLPGIFAQDAPVSTAGNVITTGSSVILPITVTNFTNIATCDLKLFYDPSIATVTSVTVGSAISGPNTGFNFNNTVPGAVNFGWFATPGRNVPDNTVVFNIHFSKVSDGISQVTWSTVNYECEYFDGNYNALNDSPSEAFYIPGSVIFQEYAPTTAIMPVTACAGTNISVPVKVSDFNAIGAVSLTINYDAAVLDFLPGDNTSGYPGLSINNTTAGTIIIGGFSSS